MHSKFSITFQSPQHLSKIQYNNHSNNPIKQFPLKPPCQTTNQHSETPKNPRTDQNSETRSHRTKFPSTTAAFDAHPWETESKFSSIRDLDRLRLSRFIYQCLYIYFFHSVITSHFRVLRNSGNCSSHARRPESGGCQ